jgi:adenosine deaminase
MLKPHRIGHGVHLTREALNWVFENRVPIEVCPTSAVLVRMVDDYSAIPAIHYFIQGHPTIICTDDPLIFQNSLSQEYLTLSQRTSLNWDQLRQMAKNAFDHTFLSEEEKQSIFGQYHY